MMLFKKFYWSRLCKDFKLTLSFMSVTHDNKQIPTHSYQCLFKKKNSHDFINFFSLLML